MINLQLGQFMALSNVHDAKQQNMKDKNSTRLEADQQAYS